MAWYNTPDAKCDVAISSRVRLARNISPYPFISRLDTNGMHDISQKCEEARNKSEWLSKETKFVDLTSLSGLQLQKMVEKNLISPNLFGKSEHRAVILDKDETISVMVNEEDHIRIQCIFSGLDLDNAWYLADKVDDTFEETLDYSFSPQLGYLTYCPTNVGTGMRASVMLHLPVLSMLRRMEGILNAAGKIGITIRGTYGEGSGAVANIYQISNQITLGISEILILEKLKDIVDIIISKEKEARKSIMNVQGTYLRDRVCRALGIMQNAVLLSSNEFMKLWSDVMLGVNLGIIDKISPQKLLETMVYASPAHISDSCKEDSSVTNRDLQRATFVRKQLQGV